MADDQITVRRWKPDQIMAARLRACGYTQQAIADKLGVELTTVQRWHEIDEWRDLVDAEFRRGWERIEPGIMANVQLALDVQSQMLRGEVQPNDRRYAEARRIIDRIVDRLLSIEPRGGADSGPDADPSAPMLLNPGGGGGRDL